MSLTQRLSSIHRRAKLIERSTIPGAMRMLADAGLTSQSIEGGVELVAGRFEFYPAIGWWRSKDGMQRGYNVRTLIEAARL